MYVRYDVYNVSRTPRTRTYDLQRGGLTAVLGPLSVERIKLLPGSRAPKPLTAPIASGRLGRAETNHLHVLERGQAGRKGI